MTGIGDDAYPFPDLLNKLLGHSMILEPDEAVIGERLHELVGGGLALLGRTVEKLAKVDEGKLEGRKVA